MSVLSLEQHYSVHEVAERWKISADMVRELFQDYPGVLKFTNSTYTRKRAYTTLRIPASVLDRFHEERSRGFSLKVKRGRGSV